MYVFPFDDFNYYDQAQRDETGRIPRCLRGSDDCFGVVIKVRKQYRAATNSATQAMYEMEQTSLDLFTAPLYTVRIG